MGIVCPAFIGSGQENETFAMAKAEDLVGELFASPEGDEVVDHIGTFQCLYSRVMCVVGKGRTRLFYEFGFIPSLFFGT